MMRAAAAQSIWPIWSTRPPEEIEEARALAGRAAPGLFPVLFDRWARAVDEASRLPMPRLLFEMAALDLCSAEPMVPLGNLLQRLEELEGRLRGSGGRPSRRRRATAGGCTCGARSFAGSAPAAVAAPACPGSRRAAARPPATAVSPTEEVGEQWRRVLAAFESKGPRLASLLAHAEVVSLGVGDATLAFASKRDARAGRKGARRDRTGRIVGARTRDQGDDHDRGTGAAPCFVRRWAAKPKPRTPTASTENRKRASIP